MIASARLYKLLQKRAGLCKTAAPWLNEGDFMKLCKRVQKQKAKTKHKGA